jgi:hypothetical protein
LGVFDYAGGNNLLIFLSFALLLLSPVSAITLIYVGDYYESVTVSDSNNHCIADYGTGHVVYQRSISDSGGVHHTTAVSPSTPASVLVDSADEYMFSEINCAGHTGSTHWLGVKYLGVTPGFNYTPHSGFAPLHVDFTSTSKPNNKNNDYWQFGGGFTDTGVTTHRTFSNVGVFSVTLTSSNPYDSKDISYNVTVNNPAPTLVDFTGDPLSGGVPHEVILTSDVDVPVGAPGISDYYWGVTKPNGVVYSDHGSSMTTYEFLADQLGYYSVILTVTQSDIGYSTSKIALYNCGIRTNSDSNSYSCTCSNIFDYFTD